MTNLEYALTVLSSMITPAVLISACASLAISTSNRLSRAMDRTRKLSEQFKQVAQAGLPDSSDEVMMLYHQLGWSVRRSRLLQHALTSLYLSLSVFIATSVAIGLISLTDERFTIVPIILGLFGAGLLLYTSMLLIAEIRLSRIAIHAELDFVLRVGTQAAPKEVLERQPTKRRRLL